MIQRPIRELPLLGGRPRFSSQFLLRSTSPATARSTTDLTPLATVSDQFAPRSPPPTPKSEPFFHLLRSFQRVGDRPQLLLGSPFDKSKTRSLPQKRNVANWYHNSNDLIPDRLDTRTPSRSDISWAKVNGPTASLLSLILRLFVSRSRRAEHTATWRTPQPNFTSDR